MMPMNKKVPNSVAVTVLSMIVVTLGCWVYFGDTVFRQTRRMKLAHQYLPGISNAVASHAHFENVRMVVTTGGGGCFMASGWVDTEGQLTELERVIDETKPPLKVLYRLKVLERYSDTNRAGQSSDRR